jgi:hypothetical protein
VSIENAAPDNLNDYVRGGKKTPRFQNVVHIYVPETADIQTVKVDGKDAKFGSELEDGRVGVTIYTEIPVGEVRQISVQYNLEVSGGYTFEATPQPLSNDPTFDLHLTLPEEWSVRGPGDIEDGRLELSGFMDRTVRVVAEPRHRMGLSAAWARVVDFWHDPVF